MLINIDHLGHAEASFTVPLTQGMNNISCCLSALDQEADFLSPFHMNLIGGILVNASVSSRGTWIAFSLSLCGQIRNSSVLIILHSGSSSSFLRTTSPFSHLPPFNFTVIYQAGPNKPAVQSRRPSHAIVLSISPRKVS